MSEELKQMCVDILRRTGRKDLLDTGDTLAQHQKALFALIGERSGIERAEATLKEDEKKLEDELAPKLKILVKHLEIVDYRGRADIAEKELQNIQEEEHERIRQLTKVTPSSPDASAELKKLRRDIHNDYIKSVKTLLDQVSNPLKKYRRTKVMAFLIPKLSYLLFTLVIFTIGASIVGDQIEKQYLKLGLAIAVWVTQEFFIVPFYEKWLSNYKRQRLKRFARHLFYIKLWALYLVADVEHQLKGEIERKANKR